MDYYGILRKHAEMVELAPSETSFFSEPSKGLDPRLFSGTNLIPSVRNSILAMLLNFLKLEFYNPEAWAKAWLAGSGVSHNWAAERDPADLDCLVGVDFIKFRQANQNAAGLSDREIASYMNERFREELNGKEEFLGAFELTFYVNLKSNIEEIKPYAAYSLTDDTWTVPPSVLQVPANPEWEQIVERDLADTEELIKRYSDAILKVTNAPNDAIRRNAESVLANLVSQGAAMFEDIHSRRSAAFSEGGEGYADFNNYRWQAGKRSGAIAALKKLHNVHKSSKQVFNEETYGLDLPSADILIRRASTRPKFY